MGVLFCACVFLLMVILAAVYYHRRRWRRRMTPAPAPLQRIARVRSKVYTRLYPREKYERPLGKKEFVAKAEELLRLAEDEMEIEVEGTAAAGGESSFEEGASFYHGMEPPPPPPERRISAKVAAEFAELEQICFHTIQGCQRDQLSPESYIRHARIAKRRRAHFRVQSRSAVVLVWHMERECQPKLHKKIDDFSLKAAPRDGRHPRGEQASQPLQ